MVQMQSNVLRVDQVRDWGAVRVTRWVRWVLWRGLGKVLEGGLGRCQGHKVGEVGVMAGLREGVKRGLGALAVSQGG
jgi:hypothetical protein